MIIKDFIDTDFIQYKSPCCFIVMPKCSFKCEKDCGITGICQNSNIVKMENIDVDDDSLINRIINNDISKCVVFGGLEPFDSVDLRAFLTKLRDKSNILVIIYTGYTEEEVKLNYCWIYNITNVIIKFGRYIPNQNYHYDDILGVELASNNQYSKKIS